MGSELLGSAFSSTLFEQCRKQVLGRIGGLWQVRDLIRSELRRADRNKVATFFFQRRPSPCHVLPRINAESLLMCFDALCPALTFSAFSSSLLSLLLLISFLLECPHTQRTICCDRRGRNRLDQAWKGACKFHSVLHCPPTCCAFCAAVLSSLVIRGRYCGHPFSFVAVF